MTSRTRERENDFISSIHDARQAIVSATEFLTKALGHFNSLE